MTATGVGHSAVPTADAAMKRGEWPRPMTRVLHGKTIGIVGLGRIGRHVAKIANAFGMRVVAWSPRLTAETAQASGAQRFDLDDLLRESDVVSIHLTLAPEVRGLIDARDPHNLRLLRCRLRHPRDRDR